MNFRATYLLGHFYAQLRDQPSSVAVENVTQTANQNNLNSITYAQLDILSEKWSEKLRLAGIGPGCIVPLLSTRSIAMVAAVLAILKLRAIYIPIDIESWGEDRIESVLQAVDPPVIVSTSTSPAHSYPYSRVELHSTGIEDIETTKDHSAIYKGSDTADRGNDLAYIIFTSGTTGKPKGVMVGQRSISRYVTEGGELPFNLNVKAGTRVLLICSIAFDVCAGVMFNTLCNGGTLVLSDPQTLEAAAKTCHVLPLTPSILVTLDPGAGFDAVESIFLGGESPSPSLIEAWSSPHRRLYNSYGPTETTCTALMAKLLPGQPITIGFPISYSTIFLLDENGDESSEGEICIAGLGLALGYFQDPGRTANSFVTRNGIKIYKTGDYGKITDYGIQFCGRKDSMVKNRGFLINLEGDVEPALLSFDRVKRASAFMAQGRLIAFVSPVGAKTGLREHLQQTTSSFLIPDTVHSLGDFPTTSNGKVDRKRLLHMHEAEQEADSIKLETGLPALEAVQRGFSYVLRLPQSHIHEDSSFRRLGGHSLAAVMLVSTLRKMGLDVGVAEVLMLDDVSKLSKSARVMLDAAPYASPANQALLDHLKEEISMTRSLGNQKIAPMTDIQTRMISAGLSNPGHSFIKTSFTFQHPGQADLAPLLYAAWDRLHQRHEILRTSFILTASHGAQIISDEPKFAWKQRSISESEWEPACQSEELLDFNGLPEFDAGNRQSLSQVTLLTLQNRRTRFIWTVHHSLVDGWSMAALMRDFAACLDNQELPPASQFAQVSHAIHKLEFDSSDRAVTFWKDYLKGYLPAQRLRLSPPSDINDYTQGDVSYQLRVSVPALELAAKEKFAVTPATILYAAWGLLLSRYCSAENIILGAVLSGRSLPIPGVEDVIGPMINTLPLKVNTDHIQSVQGFIRSVFESLCGILDFQWSPVSLVQEASRCKPAELFETLFALQYDFPQSPWVSKLTSAPEDIYYTEVTQVPLTALLDSSEGRFRVRFLYRKSHFDDRVVQRMMRQFDGLLTGLVDATPGFSLNHITSTMLAGTAIGNFTSNSAEMARISSDAENLAQAINHMIRDHPNICAVEGLANSHTYHEFGRMTDKVARRLSKHTKSGDVICVISDGSLSWALAMIAVIKIGAIYCPIDQMLPIERKRYMVGNCQASLVLYTNSEQEVMPCDVPSLNVESIMAQDSPSADAIPSVNSIASGDDIACLIYTSGSTGLPKAVQIQHKGILNVISQPEGRLHSVPGQRNAQMLSLGFDCCIKEVFSTLCFGATLVLKDPENPISHLSRVDATMATPSLLATLDPSDYPNLKIVTVAGEAVSQALNDKWSVDRIMVNGYGPAECTLISTVARLRPGENVSIGKPLPGTSCYLLDTMKRPVPIGVSGEIYLAGIQVTPGYLYNEQETAKRFLSDPFHPGQIMFRTGDIGRQLESGNIEYIGREDNQIKLRGFRIDLGEVQSTISKMASAARNVALVVSNGYIIAFVTPETINVTDLAKRLESQLPEYAVPNKIIALATLPTSTNHKVDTGALKRYLIQQDKQNTRYEELETDTQRAVAVIWAEVLTRDINQMPISPKDRFFELGGHSLLQIKVAQAISKQWNIRPLPLKTVIRHPILQDLSLAIEELLGDSTNTNDPVTSFLETPSIPRDSDLPLSYLEKEMFLNHLISGGSPAGNMNYFCKIQGEINIETLASAFQMVTADTEVFRSRYQVLQGTFSRSLVTSIPEVPRVVQTGNLGSFVHGRVTKPFDLAIEPPVDVSIVIGRPMQAMLVVVMSHVVGDATTMATYLNQVSETYDFLAATPQTGSGTILPRRSTTEKTYIDWAHWSQAIQPIPRTLSFWSSYLSDLPRPLTFGSPKPAPATYMGFTRSWTLSVSMFRSLSQIATKASVTMHQIALAGVFFCLQCLDRRDDMLLAAPFTHRTEGGTEHMSGLFLDRLLIRIRRKILEHETLVQFLGSVRESSQQALENIIPFRTLRQLVQFAPSLSDPLFKVMVTYHTAADQRPLLKLKGAEVQPIPCRNTGGSKFPLTVEFTETTQQEILVDMECDMGCISEEVAQRLEFALMFALQLMILETTPGEIIDLGASSFKPAPNSGVGCTNTMAQEAKESGDRRLQEQGLSSNGAVATVGTDAVEIFSEAIGACLDLDKPEIDSQKSIWELGASSMDAIRFQKLCEERGIQVSLRDVFLAGSIGQLAARDVMVRSL
ncbi:nonribosomal peptide synthetase hasD [Aspergillus affinis]|uniref:nonribosomal peptide synthetase hasD n=1 Tax=Aspergillus affinis TaxID=1070780 RepID=UPI0022FDDDBB|nr:nonribosomal peptide synthase GliP2 [Aspergillus affinis]KAI9042724.1 nonribosomal peptide synthase GliP2 [Aspergillus affinis]